MLVFKVHIYVGQFLTRPFTLNEVFFIEYFSTKGKHVFSLETNSLCLIANIIAQIIL